MNATLTVTNSDGREFLVLVQNPGNSIYSDEPTVTFFDHQYTAHGPHGQKVSSYYVSTLLEREGDGHSLDLHGGVDEWWIDARAMTRVYRFVRATAGEYDVNGTPIRFASDPC